MSIDDLASDQEQEQDPIREATFEQSTPSFQLPSFLTAPTGEGSIASYLDHPMNYNNSDGMAQVIRGLTGMFGSLNKAAIDIVLGVMRMRKPKA
jgi:hypothetical protein